MDKTAGQVAFEAYVEADPAPGIWVPEWSDLTPTERDRFEAAAMAVISDWHTCERA